MNLSLNSEFKRFQILPNKFINRPWSLRNLLKTAETANLSASHKISMPSRYRIVKKITNLLTLEI